MCRSFLSVCLCQADLITAKPDVTDWDIQPEDKCALLLLLLLLLLLPAKPPSRVFVVHVTDSSFWRATACGTSLSHRC